MIIHQQKIFINLFSVLLWCASSASFCNTPSVFVPASSSPSVFVPASPTAGNAKPQHNSRQNIPAHNKPQHRSNSQNVNNNNYNNYNNNNNYHRHFNHHHNNTIIYPYVTYVPATVVNDDEDESYVREVPDDNNRVQDNVNRAPVPNGNWQDAHNGDVPDNAVPYTNANELQAEDGSTATNAFYCRGVYNNTVVDGILVPQEGCYVDDSVNAATIRLQNYQVLTN